MNATSEPLLRVKNLCMSFESKRRFKRNVVRAIDDITFDIIKSEVFGLVGESGCGKTTTGRTIIRLYSPLEGSIVFQGRELTGRMNRELKDYITSNISMVFQDPIDSLNPRMTVHEIISEGLKVRGVSDRNELNERVHDILLKVGLTKEHASRYPHEFSGGQRQRIGIARAIIVNPSMVIADEPVSALDVSIQAQIINLLQDLKADMGLTVLFIAHDLSVVKHFSDRIGVMYRGKLVEVAEADELFRNPIHPYTKALLSAIPLPNPLSERNRKRILYDADTEHNYTEEPPAMVEIYTNHFVYASQSEAEQYRKHM